MTENKTKELTVFKPHFCGGIFFAILLESKTNKNDTQVFDGLAHLFKGSSNTEPKAGGRSIDKSVSNYKKCLESSKTYIPFINGTYQSAFLDKYNEKRQELYNALFKFCEEYLDGVEASKTALIKRLIGIMQLEELNTNILIDYENEKPVSTIEASDTVQFYPVLLSIMHYAFTQVPDVDERHKDGTFKHLFTQKNKNSKWELSKEQDKQLIGKLTNLTVMFDRKTVASNEESNPFQEKNTDNLNSKEYDFELSLIDKYHQKVINNSKVKTFLNPDTASDFSDVYVRNYIKYDSVQTDPQNITVIEKISRHVIIQGTAGSGKTMLMRHLLLSAIDEASHTKKIPLLLKKLNCYKGETLLELILKSIQTYVDDISIDKVKSWLNSGTLQLLIDGLDEIRTEYYILFNDELESFVEKYNDVTIIMTSRPINDFRQYSSFHRADICPLTKEQAIELIKKQKWDENEKNQFILELSSENGSTYAVRKEFASVPLLLLIMLMTYSLKKTVINNYSSFYENMYVTLTVRHNQMKNINKKLFTGLSYDEFEDYFASFCKITYCDKVHQFTRFDIKKYVKQLLGDSRIFSADSFISDITKNICLMYAEGDTYYFIHRSVQEYYAAERFALLPDNGFSDLLDFYKKETGASLQDISFYTLYELVPDRVEKLLVYPFLKQIISTKEDPYLEYIKNMYFCFWCDDQIFFYPEPTIFGSYVTKIIYEKYFYKNFDCEEPPLSTKKMIYTEMFCGPRYLDDDSIMVPIEAVLKAPKMYKNLLDYIRSPQCSIFKEYMCVLDFVDQIKRKS